MTDQEFAEMLALGHELTGIEFKGSGFASNRQLFAQVAKAVLGMANRRDGGRVVIGVADSGGVLTPEQLFPWDNAYICSELLRMPQERDEGFAGGGSLPI